MTPQTRTGRLEQGAAMGRMFSLAAEAVREAPPAPTHRPFGFDDEPTDDADAPFVEVGGPAGPVYSPKLAAVPKPVPAPVVAPPAPITETPRPAGFPRLASAPAYLSVSFHELRVANPAPRTDGPAAELVAFHAPDHPVSGEYRAVREDIRRQLAETGPFALYFAAPAAESGTTTVMLNLAVTVAAGGGGRVLVIDAAGKRAAVAAKLGLRAAPGLAEVLAEQVPFAWAVQPTAVPNLHALTAGATPPACRDLPRLVAQARQWFDWVLIDGGAWGESPERDAACPSADAVYLVARDTAVDGPAFAGVRSWVRELGGLPRGYIATRA